MNINWLGGYTIRIVSQGKTIILDPHSPAQGTSPPRGKVDLIGLTNPNNPATSHISGFTDEALIINSPGEYSYQTISVMVKGWHDQDNHERNLQRWEVENITLLHLGALPSEFSLASMPDIEQSNIDILFLPIGGGESMDTGHALELLHQVEPKIVIPVHYSVSGSKEDIEPVDNFAQEMGVDPKVTEQRLSISSLKLPHEGMDTILLKP